ELEDLSPAAVLLRHRSHARSHHDDRPEDARGAVPDRVRHRLPVRPDPGPGGRVVEVRLHPGRVPRGRGGERAPVPADLEVTVLADGVLEPLDGRYAGEN